MSEHARRHAAVSCAKMAEQIEMSFGLWTRVRPRKHVLHGVHTCATWRIRLIRPCSGVPNEAAAMRPYAKLLWLRLLVFICQLFVIWSDSTYNLQMARDRKLLTVQMIHRNKKVGNQWKPVLEDKCETKSYLHILSMIWAVEPTDGPKRALFSIPYRCKPSGNKKRFH